MSNSQLYMCLLLSAAGLCVADLEIVYGSKGSSINFICPYRKTSTNNVQWFFQNSSLQLLISDGNITIPNNPLYSRVTIVGNHAAGEYNLQLSDLRESDAEVYICAVGFQEKNYTLELLAAPSSLTLQDVTTGNKILGAEGQSLNLRCDATGGKPPPLVTITVDNVPKSATQSVEYTITTLERRHDRQGIYCQAYNTALTSPLVANATLYLYLKPSQPIFSLDPVSTEETSLLVVSCTSTGSRPAATFQWTIGLANVTDGATTQVTNSGEDIYTVISTLRYNMDRKYNGQSLTCTSVNVAASNGVKSSTTLDVKFAPVVTVTNITYNQDNDTRLVTCKPDGNPTTYAYYRWLHRSTYGELIRQLDGGQDGVLTLPSVPVEARYQDSGEYVCTASNGITGRDGKIQLSGSGYVTVNAIPQFTSGNKITEYGEFGKDVDIHVYVYSVPKYTSLRWYKPTTQISNLNANKYTLSEVAATVTDTFHGTMLQLNGYRLTLTIKNLMESDFNVSYRVEVSNGVGQPVVYTTLLVSASHPQTPSCFTVPSTSESSVLVQWEPGDNGGHVQTFYAEYREFGSKTWISVKIPDTKQTGRHNYTLNGLHDGALYELRMYAENKFNKSSPTEIITIKTIKDYRLSSSEAAIGGVAGGLSAVIVILTVIIIVLVHRKQGTRQRNSMAQTSRLKDESSYHNYIDCKENDEQEDTQAETDKLKTSRSTQEYESLGIKDNPSTYSELLTQQGTHQTRYVTEYEILGMTENLNTYSELHNEQDQKESDNTTELYESLGDRDKSTVCPQTKAELGSAHSEYTNIKI